jgi:hypothetical protein
LALREIFDPLQVGDQHVGVADDVVRQFAGESLQYRGETRSAKRNIS